MLLNKELGRCVELHELIKFSPWRWSHRERPRIVQSVERHRKPEMRSFYELDFSRCLDGKLSEETRLFNGRCRREI